MPADRSTCATRIVAATVLFGIALGLYSWLVPMWRAPDERSHIDLVLDVSQDGSYPAWDANLYRDSVLRASDLATARLAGTRMGADAAPTREDRPSLVDLGGDRVRPGAYNHMAQHPPAYYGLLGILYRSIAVLLPVEEAPADRTVAILRLSNAVFVLLIPAVSWWTARRAGLGRSVALTAALIPLCIPGLAHIGSAVNNDNLLTLLAGVALALAVGVARGDARIVTGVALGSVVATALLTKAFGVVLMPLAVGAYVLGARTVRDRRQFVRAAGVCSALIMAGTSWYVLNVLRFGSPLPTLDDARFATSPEGFTPSVRDWLTGFAGYMAQGFWGRPGAFDIQLPNPYTAAATLVLLGLVAVGFGYLWARSNRGVAILLIMTLPATLLLVGVNSYRLYARSGQDAFVHGRYLMPAVTGVAVLAAHGIGRLLGKRARWAASGVVLLLAAVMHRMSILRIYGRYWGEPGDSLPEQTRAAIQWSPWPAPLTIAMGSAAAIAGVWAVWVLVRRPTDLDGELSTSHLYGDQTGGGGSHQEQDAEGEMGERYAGRCE